MTEPSEQDPPEVHRQYKAMVARGERWAYASRPDVEENIRSTGIPGAQVVYVEGKVEDTIPETIPERVSLLRLDTDWYESTRHEPEHLWPRLERGGVLIIDDYGDWEGARRAVDEFFVGLGHRPLLSRLDYTGRMLVQDTDS